MTLLKEQSRVPSSKAMERGFLTTLLSAFSWKKHTQSRPLRTVWKPTAFGIAPLLVATLVSWALIAILQLLLVKSQKDGGIIFATNIEDIPFGISFLYLYLPTVIALVLSIFWSWIDLQIKRLEPYYQLSKANGAWGKDSLLLSYPFDFLPFVPFGSFKNRHWAVFWASTCIVFLTWGLVPLQAGIFAVETIHVSLPKPFLRSTGFVPASEQSDLISSRYIHSAHGIIWLNETLPPYMTREYVLAPFAPQSEGPEENGKNDTWTAQTTLYSLDVHCEAPQLQRGGPMWTTNGTEIVPTGTYAYDYMGINGCKWPSDYYKQVGNDTIGPNPAIPNQEIFNTKEFTSVYVGYYPTDYADFYLKGICPKEASHTCKISFSLDRIFQTHSFVSLRRTRNKRRNDVRRTGTVHNIAPEDNTALTLQTFANLISVMVMFTRNRKSARDPPSNVTRLFCDPFYYQQEVIATISAKTRAPINITYKGEKQILPVEKWNSTFFEYQMNTGSANGENRGALPQALWPDQLETLSTYPVSMSAGSTIMTGMAAYMIGAARRPLEELLDPEVLKDAYQSAYRIIFARSMIEILDQNFRSTESVSGNMDYNKGAVALVPVFTYIVQGFLGFVSICSMVLLVISMRRKWTLSSDPATIASVQSLVADNAALLEDFGKLERLHPVDFEQSLKTKKFRLESNGQHNMLVEADNFDPVTENSHGLVRTDSKKSEPLQPVRPKEFKSHMVLPFVIVLIGLAVVLGVLYYKSQPYGIARPSTNPVVRQLIENYIPTALATLIEPVWVLVNRLLCMLQPLEELRGGNAVAGKSIDADYSTLPPQIVIFKALRSSHFKLAAVCAMALLANILAVAFSGMFEELPTLVPRTLDMIPPYESKFVAINGTVGPSLSSMVNVTTSGAFTGGVGINQFMVAESNYTAGTPLPPWTDNQFMYIPFMDSHDIGETEGVEARTMAFGATIECNKVEKADYSAYLFHGGSGYQGSISLTVADSASDTRVTCKMQTLFIESGPPRHGGVASQCQSGKLALEIVFRLHANSNATVAERRVCEQYGILGYVRGDEQLCKNKVGPTELNDESAVFVACKPRLVAGEANVRVDRDGRVQNVSDLSVSSELSSDFFSNHFSITNNTSVDSFSRIGAGELFRQAHGYLFRWPGCQWHNDAFASEFLNYFMIRQNNDSRLLDPNLGVPSPKEITERFYPTYSKLFAIWLGVNKDKLLVPRQKDSTTMIQGTTRELQIRIFFVKPLFIIAEVILGLYTIVALCIYLWRPGRFLLRMPTSIGAVITSFAASEAVLDMRGTSLMTKKERKRHLKDLKERYGYGRFVGTDGVLHEGIEKEPLVDAVPLLGIVQKVQTGLSQKGFSVGYGRKE